MKRSCENAEHVGTYIAWYFLKSTTLSLQKQDSSLRTLANTSVTSSVDADLSSTVARGSRLSKSMITRLPFKTSIHPSEPSDLQQFCIDVCRHLRHLSWRKLKAETNWTRRPQSYDIVHLPDLLSTRASFRLSDHVPYIFHPCHQSLGSLKSLRIMGFKMPTSHSIIQTRSDGLHSWD